jgi:TrmH family RNA methyltransferase
MALDGTADPWAPKTVRASAGMVFRLPVVTCACGEALEALEARGLPLLVADARGEPPGPGSRSAGWALAVGNEGAGPRPRVLKAADAVLRIPMPGPAESLNAGVAGSILLYALTTQETRGVPTG